MSTPYEINALISTRDKEIHIFECIKIIVIHDLSCPLLENNAFTIVITKGCDYSYNFCLNTSTFLDIGYD